MMSADVAVLIATILMLYGAIISLTIYGILNAIASLKYPRARLNHNNAHNILIYNCFLLLHFLLGRPDPRRTLLITTTYNFTCRLWWWPSPWMVAFSGSILRNGSSIRVLVSFFFDSKTSTTRHCPTTNTIDYVSFLERGSECKITCLDLYLYLHRCIPLHCKADK